MLNKELTQKKYFELITTGHYIDVQNSQGQWVMARVLEKDKKYIWVTYDGLMKKQDQFLVYSYRVAPLRAHTEGFTGSYLKIYRNNMPKVQHLKNYIEIAQQKFFNEKAKAFQITQLLRGQFFVYVHDLLCREVSLTEDQIQETNKFLDLWMNFLLNVINKVIEYQEEYFAAPLATNKLLYLTNPRIALIQSLQQLLVLLQLIVKADAFKYVNLWKVQNKIKQYNKGITSQQKLAEDFLKKKGLQKLYVIFVANDKKGQWYPSSTRKLIYKIMLKYSLSKVNYSMPQMPKYLIRDFQQVYSIIPFMWRCSPEILLENEIIDFSISILLTNSPFDAKLKSIQQLRKILEGKNQFQFLDQKKVLTKMDQMGVLQQLLDNKNFNPEVFKRFVPILNVLCKIRSLSLKHIQALFQQRIYYFRIVRFRHESETGIIFDIISEISEFAPSSLLDNVYTEICKIDINSEQTMKFIKTFTIKAVQNLSKEKSILGGLFGRKKGGSSKYGYYGLNILYKESHDDGRITRQKIIFSLNIIKQMLSENALKQERWNYMNYCIDFIKTRKNFGQSIKLICLIVSTFDETSFFTDDRKKVVERLQGKYNIIELIVQGFKNIDTIQQVKITHEQCYQYFYDLIQAFSTFVKLPLKVSQIEFLWYKCDSTYLLNFLRKPRPNQKNKKLIPPEVIEQIFTVILKKTSFYKRPLTFHEFQTIYQLFISYQLDKENVSMNIKDGLVRYNKANLLGLDYFINFLEHTRDQQNFQKATKKTIQIILRPNPNKNISIDAAIQHKVLVWKDIFKRSIERLLSDPKKCLVFVQLFYSSIEGKLFKEINTNDTSNAQILVQFNQQTKTISIERFSTIFRLRKFVKQKFRIDYDFDMFNVKINKAISFEQEEDFSVNAMPLVDNGRSISIKVQLKINKYHQQQLACLMFKKEIEKEEKLYSMIFKIIQEKELEPEVEKIFWKAIQLLPLNKSMMAEIQKCDSFTLEKWMKYFQTTSDSSLQYKLSIVLNLINGSKKWVFKMEQTHGLIALILTLLKTLQKWSNKFENEALSIKIMDVIEKIYDKVTKKQLQEDLLNEMNVTLINALDLQFNPLLKQSKQKISLTLINKILSVYLSNLKMLMCDGQKQIYKIQLKTFLNILNLGLFVKKCQTTQKFAQEISISLNYAIYDNPQDKIQILNFLIDNLNLEKLLQRERTQNYFKFFITILYSFEDTSNITNQEQTQMKTQKLPSQTPKILSELMHIWEFINNVLQCQSLKDNQKSSEQIIYGLLSLTKFILTKSNEEFQVDTKQIYRKLIDNFVFPSNYLSSKRIKTERNKKILFEILKKISFQNPQTLSIMTDKLVPFLQRNKYRKNSILNWNLHFENNEKKIFVGLQNLGATCYINCLFQQLFMIKSFRESFMSIESRSFKPQLDQNQIYQLQKIFYSLKYGNRRSQTTKNFCSSFITFEGQPISPVVQSDADEFFNTLMDRIQSFLKLTCHHDILEKTFQGQLSNQLNCQGCPHRSEKIEPFMSIGVNLKNKKTLQEALKGYVEGEILDGDNAYYCQPCDKKVRTLKRLCIKQLPNILVIVLKRFQYDFDTYKKIKINSYLEFPQKLNMTEFTTDYLQGKSMQKVQAPMSDPSLKLSNSNEQKNIFHLRGTVIHAGYADAGHYYSFIKENEKWYQFNDEFIKEINYSKIQEEGFGGDDKDSDDLKIQKYKNAYILFYERESLQKQPQIQKQQVLQSQNGKLDEIKQQQKQKPDSNFAKEISSQILNENYETSIFSSLMELNFIHFWQNLSILQNFSIRKFMFLYFHTIILRDKFKYEYATNYFRILTKYLSNSEGELKNSETAEWFLQQVNKDYIREFLIEASKTVRFVCMSLVLTAIHHAKQIPANLPLMFLSSLRKTGMSPFGQVFKALMHKKSAEQNLRGLNYFGIVNNLLFNEKKLEQLPQPQMEVESYFGSDFSESDLQKQKCSASLLESLQNYEGIDVETILKVNELYSFRKTNKIFLKKLALILAKGIENGEKNQTDVVGFIKMFQERVSSTNCGKQFVEKYLLFLRYLVWQCASTSLNNQINDFAVISFQNFIIAYCRSYEPMDWVNRQISKIASKNEKFKSCWQKKIAQNSNLKLQIETWLKEVQRPQYINMKDDFFEKIRQMQLNDKSSFLKKYAKKMRKRTAWMFDSNSEQVSSGEESQLENAKENETVQVRNKSFVIKERFEQGILYLASYPQKDDNTLWIYLEKNEIQTFNNL